jgi:hypothetical protein
MKRGTIPCNLAMLLCTLICTVFSPQPAGAGDIVANDPQNDRWLISEKGMKVTFLGKDQPEPAVLILNKAAVLEKAFTVESDGNYLVLQ